MNRRGRIMEIDARLGRRKLLWFGTRGADALPLVDLPQLQECYSIIAPLRVLAVKVDECLELMRGERMDVDTYTIDDDHTGPAEEFHRRLMSSLGEPSWVALYRPNSFFTSVYFPRADRVRYLGLFHERQGAFEHKPWVESELRDMGVRVLPWVYFVDEDWPRLVEMATSGPIVVRTSRSDGGAGIRVIHHVYDMPAQWPSHTDRFISAAPYLVPNIPLNVGGCVFSDGSISLHGPSLQLIGIPRCTTLSLGYCGNDFARVRDLSTDVLDDLEELVVGVGRWLGSRGYLGAFGVDALVHDGKVYMTEVNPRFQGSSLISAELDRRLDRPDLFLNHLAAFLRLPCPPQVRLRELAAEQPEMSQVVCHNTDPWPVVMSEAVERVEGAEFHLLPEHDLLVAPQGTMFRAVFDMAVTETGFSLSNIAESTVERARAIFRKASLSVSL